jgi:hypothetical protein
MKNLFIGIVIGILAMAGIYGISLLFSSEAAPQASPAPAGASGAGVARAGSVVDMICELHLDLEGQKTLGIQGNEPPRITLAQIDLEQKSGWYQGKISISEGRGGSLTLQGNKFVVTRPAMFQRFGTSISQEAFSIDRSTGQFEQSLTIEGGKVVPLIRGTCARVIKPPF